MLSDPVVSEIAAAARAAGFEPAALLAIAEIESGGRIFARIGSRSEPLIRFEGHYFDRRLAGADRKRARALGLAHPKAGAVRNPTSQRDRWALLKRAAQISREAAYESCSWGLGQVMGAHWAWLGYGSVDALVAEARHSAAGQLRLMIRYIEKAGLSGAIRTRDWTAFARGYNGPAYARHRYHTRIAKAYGRYAALELPAPQMRKLRSQETAAGQTDLPLPPTLKRGDRGAHVADLQQILTAYGHPASVDGVFGPATDRALRAFQHRHGLLPDGIAGPATWTALTRKRPFSAIGEVALQWWRACVASLKTLLVR